MRKSTVPFFFFPARHVDAPLLIEFMKAGSRRCVNGCPICAEFDASVMLVHNTPWARGFFRKAHQAQQRPAAMASVLAEDIRLHGERNTTLEQVPCSPCRGGGSCTPQPFAAQSSMFHHMQV